MQLRCLSGSILISWPNFLPVVCRKLNWKLWWRTFVALPASSTAIVSGGVEALVLRFGGQDVHILFEIWNIYRVSMDFFSCDQAAL